MWSRRLAEVQSSRMGKKEELRESDRGLLVGA